ncbi:MAG: phenylacetate--CoA ligase family protein [Burkholderiales bacterium]
MNTGATHSPPWHYRSTVSGADWPAVPDPHGANLLALLFQFERTQWLPPAELRALQDRQLTELLRHAWETVPYYRECWRTVFDPARPPTTAGLARLPLLTRAQLRDRYADLQSTRPPPAHGRHGHLRTSGSTGVPLRTVNTEVNELLWSAITLREHAWQGRDLGGKLAAIRQGVQAGETPGWGPSTDAVVVTGPCVLLPVNTPVNVQLEWLQREQPDTLLSHPSNIAELARQSLARGLRLPRLREVRTSGEMLPEGLRELCREAWDVPVTDMYSANEVGYLALQCPNHVRYHVQAESVLVEVIDAAGHPCAPGDIGRVVVTTLQNFAMPLVRYEIGDYAEVGMPCPCGRGLPVLERIVGRVRNMLVLPSGERAWPAFALRALMDEIPLLQHQFVQKSLDLIEARLVTAAPLSAAQENRLREHLLAKLPPGFRMNFVYCESIPRSAGGKFEDLVSEVSFPSH